MYLSSLIVCISFGFLVACADVLDPEITIATIKSRDFSKTVANNVLKIASSFMHFHSTIPYLDALNAESQDESSSLNVKAEIDRIASRVDNDGYENAYEFQKDLSLSFRRAHSRDLWFDTRPFHYTYRFHRPSAVALVALSIDGVTDPRIYRTSTLTDPRPTDESELPYVSLINGVEVFQFLDNEADVWGFCDRHTRFNSMLAQAYSPNQGRFLSPMTLPVPEASTNLTLSNGTVLSVPNFVNFAADEPPAESAPELPASFSFYRVTSRENIAVLRVRDFNGDFMTFKRSVDSFFTALQNEDVDRMVIDIRGNEGGKAKAVGDNLHQFWDSQPTSYQSAYLFQRLFTDIEAPRLCSRMRCNEASRFMLEAMSQYFGIEEHPEDHVAYKFSTYIDVETGLPFESWRDICDQSHGEADEYMSKPFRTFPYGYHIDEVTPFLSAPSDMEGPFKAEDILVLSDGICGSSGCAAFVEMVTTAVPTVKRLSVGGLPGTHPMPIIGGEKNTGYITMAGLHILNEQAADYAEVMGIDPQKLSWMARFRGTMFPMTLQDDASFNAFTTVNEDDLSTPLETKTDYSHCRMFYTNETWRDEGELFGHVAAVGWGRPMHGGVKTFEPGLCAEGSWNAPPGWDELEEQTIRSFSAVIE